MKYIRLNTTDPYYNLALEEYLFKNADDDVFILWQNEPSVIAGKNQNVYAEVDLEYAKTHGIHVCRRITGGGAVYHDLGNVNYTFISANGSGKMLDFEYFSRPIRNAVGRLGVASRMSDRNDIECEGGKFSGNAQHAEGGRILHHGTLLFDTDFNVLEAVLKVDKEKLDYRAVKSCRSRVVNLASLVSQKISVDNFLCQIERSVCEELCADYTEAPKNEEIDLLYTRNKTHEWIFSDRRYLTKYTVERKKKYSFGLVKAELELFGDTLRNVKISGDFFGQEPIEKLEAILIGMRRCDILAVDPSPYIGGMSGKELYELLT